MPTKFRVRANCPRALCAAILLCGGAFAADASFSPANAEFGGQCAEALSEGRHVSTNCSVTWIDKDGKTYCFSNADAKQAFMRNPAEKLERAREFMAAGNVEATETARRTAECLRWTML